MVAKKKLNKKVLSLEVTLIGQKIFLAAIVLALVLGVIVPYNSNITAIMIILGIAIGIMNVTAQEANSFLIASLALMLTFQSLFALPWLSELLKGIFGYVLYTAAPAALIVSLGAIYKLASVR